MAIISEEQMQELLYLAYNKAIDGIPTSKSVADLANEYLEKSSSKTEAINRLVNNQVLKCGSSGFITGLGGLITLPIAVPANITSVLYVQLRMIACIAYIGGYNPSDDTVRTLAYLCLTGSAFTDILKQTGIKVGNKVTINLLKKLPGTVLTKINQKVGFRLLTKFGEKGVVNLVKVVPVIGGGIGGTVDVISTKIMAKNAIKAFVEEPENVEIYPL